MVDKAGRERFYIHMISAEGGDGDHGSGPEAFIRKLVNLTKKPIAIGAWHGDVADDNVR
jgi:hypothetical protein